MLSDDRKRDWLDDFSQEKFPGAFGLCSRALETGLVARYGYTEEEAGVIYAALWEKAVAWKNQ